MKKKIMISVMLIMSIATASGAAEIVKFKGINAPKSSEPLILTGKLSKPKGKAPYPAVVLLHGCNGINKYHEVWAKENGYRDVDNDQLNVKNSERFVNYEKEKEIDT